MKLANEIVIVKIMALVLTRAMVFNGAFVWRFIRW